MYDNGIEDKQARILPCGHTFCTSCCVKLMKDGAAKASESTNTFGAPLSCPTCRTKHSVHAGVSSITRNHAVEACIMYVQALLVKVSEAAQGQQQGLHSGGSEHDGTGQKASVGDELATGIEAKNNPVPALRPAAPSSRLPAAGVSPQTVFSAVVEALQRAGRPLALSRVAQILEDKRLWPPSGLAEMMAAQQRESGARSMTATSVAATQLARPSPSVVKGFVLSRVQALQHSGPHLQGSAAAIGASIHVEVSTRLITECLCLGGSHCTRLSSVVARSAPAVSQAGSGGLDAAVLQGQAAVYRPQVSQAQLAATRQVHSDDESDSYQDRWDEYADRYDAVTSGACLGGGGNGGRRRGKKR